MKIKQLEIFVMLLAIVLTVRLSESDAKVKTFIQKIKGGGYVMDATQTTDGNYISVSRADATSATWIVRKVTPLGKRIWERKFSQVANGYWSLQSIAQTNEGYVLVGSAYDTEPGESLSAAIVVALHSDGTVNWTKRFGITTSFGASAAIGFTTVTSTADGGFIVTGWAYEVPFLLLKFVQDGNIQWQKAFSPLHQV
ncbi:MAG TPA: hypothetical protein VLH08_19260, partial [Acidobacteriota bacterium]|nr:hypothetical protein [Acidobacteriota bacterium]